MSLDPILWAMKDAPVADAEEWAILACLAEKADDDGCSAFLSQGTIAKRVRLAVRTVRRRLDAMEDRGLISRGDQDAAAYIAADKRPIVWDLMIPLSWFSNVDRIQEYRERKGRDPLTSEERPDLSAAPEKLRRIDYGTPKRPDSQSGGTSSPPGPTVRPDSQSTTGGLPVHDGGTTSPPNSKFLTLPLDEEEMRNAASRRRAPSSPESGKVGRTGKTLDQHFTEFWAAYPRRKQKGEARAAWDKARKRATLAEILDGAERLAAAGGDPAYIPYPATWLNRDGWNDEPDPQPTPGVTPTGEIDVTAILGRDLWQPPTPPAGIHPGTPEYIEWLRVVSAEHYAERLAEAKARIARRQA